MEDSRPERGKKGRSPVQGALSRLQLFFPINDVNSVPDRVGFGINLISEQATQVHVARICMDWPSQLTLQQALF
jgi:hypothetical protein